VELPIEASNQYWRRGTTVRRGTLPAGFIHERETRVPAALPKTPSPSESPL
jgi:hypothetical protein